MIRWVLLSFLLGLAYCVHGQKSDSTNKTKPDSVTSIGPDTQIIQADSVPTIKSYASRYNPRKAMMYSAILPGSGQFYNKKYWKAPIVWGGFIALGYAIGFYQDQYLLVKSELFLAINSSDPSYISPHGFTEAQLRTITDQSRRQRDFFVAMTGILYALQMVDAHVDAHLKEFDLNPSLRVSIEPRVMQNAMTGRTTGVSIFFRF
jgi:hypothetical protein